MVEDAAVSGPGAPPVVPAGAEALDFGYTITTEAFSGPLDLLLFLVRRTEVDVFDIPLVTVIDQFVSTVQAWQDMDLEVAGDFIAMAATLLEIKARLVAPPPEGEEQAEDDGDLFDPRADLINALLAYRRFKEAAQLLSACEAEAAGRVSRQYHETIPEDPDDIPDLELGEIDSHLLMRTCEIILARINGLGPRTVPIDDVPLTVRINELIELMRERKAATMRELLAHERATAARLGTVLATLECTRQRFIELKQFEQYGDVNLRWREDDERNQAPFLPPAEEPPAGKRRRRPPLVTWTPPPRPADAVEEDDAATPEEPQETDEQRFLRELDELCGLSGVLEKTQNVESSFLAHWYELHPELKPPEPPKPEPPPQVEAVPATPATPRKPPVKRLPDAVKSEAPPPVSPASEAATPPIPVASVDVTTPPSPGETPVAVTEAPATSNALTTPVVTTDSPEQSLAATPIAEPEAADPKPDTPEPLPTAIIPSGETPSSVVPATPTATVEETVVATPVVDEQSIPAMAPVVPEAPTDQQVIANLSPIPTPTDQATDIREEIQPKEETKEEEEEEETVERTLDETEEMDPERRSAPLPDSETVNAALLAADDRPPPRFVETAPEGLAVGGLQGADYLAAASADIPPATSAPVEPVPAPEPEIIDAGNKPPDGMMTDEPGEVPPSPEAVCAPSTIIAEAPPQPQPASEPWVPPQDDNQESVAKVNLPAEPPAAEVLSQPAVIDQVPPPVQDPAPITVIPDTEAEPDGPPALVSASPVAETPVAADPLSVVPPTTVPLVAAEEEVVPEPVPTSVPEPAAASDAVAETPSVPLLVAATPIEDIIPDPPQQAPPDPVPPDPPPDENPPPFSTPSSIPLPTQNHESPDDDMNAARKLRLWRIAAIIIAALFLAGLLLTWLFWVPRNVLEISAGPTDGMEIDGRSPLTWHFNLDVLPEQGNPARLPTPLVTPTVSGDWSWRDRRTLVFTPGAPLPPATVFSVTLAKDKLKSCAGFHLGQDLKLAVHTPALAVQGCRTVTFAADGSTTVELSFNHAVDPAQVAAHVVAEQEGKRLELAAADTAATAAVRLRIQGSGQTSLRLPAGFTGVVGSLGTAANFATHIELGPVLHVTGSDAVMPGRGDGVIRIAADGSDLSLLAEAIRVEPSVPFRATIRSGTVELSGAFQPGADYQIQVDARWPGEHADKPLSAYPAATSFTVTMPHRQATVWTLADRRNRASITVDAINTGAIQAEVLSKDGERIISSVPVPFADEATLDQARRTRVDAQALLKGLPAGSYRLRFGDGKATSTIPVDKLVVPPDQSLAALREWQDTPAVLSHANESGPRLCLVTGP